MSVTDDLGLSDDVLFSDWNAVLAVDAATAPVDEQEHPVVVAALRYANAGLSVLPVVDKVPVLGKEWQLLATSDPYIVLQEFASAVRDYGAGVVTVGWACGKDGYVVLDRDYPWPPELKGLLDTPHAVNVTRRGEHLIWRNPNGMTPSNSTSGFPVQGWGEVRGRGGQVVIWGPDRPGFDANLLAAAGEFPRPEWLRQAGESIPAVDDTTVLTFLADHTGATAPQLLAGVLDHLDGTVGSRHESLVNVMPWAMRDARAGFYPAAEAVDRIREWYRKVVDDPGRRDGPEFGGVLSWAVGCALSEPDDQIDQRVAKIRKDRVGDESAADGRLPGGFWAERAELAHIAQAADHKMISREALLLGTLAAVSTHVPAAVYLPALPRYGTLNVMVAAVGSPGASKGSVLDIADDLVPSLPGTQHVPIGTGEGVAKSFLAPNPDKGNGQPATVQHSHPVALRTDEIDGFLAQTGRSAETLTEQLKRGWSGEALGFGYANADKRVIIPKLSYRLVVLFGVAPGKAERLFADAAGGLPQRITFAAADMDRACLPVTRQELPAWPGPLNWQMPDIEHCPRGEFGYGNREIGYHPEVHDEIEDARFYFKAHPDELTELEEHAVQMRCKLAALLAVLAGRWTVNPDDWRLAGQVMEAHRATRSWLLEVIDSTSRKKRNQYNVYAAERAERVTEAEERTKDRVRAERIVRVAQRVAGKVWAGTDEFVNGGPLRSWLGSDDRGHFDLAVEHAESVGWLDVEHVEHGTAGVRLRRGTVQP